MTKRCKGGALKDHLKPFLKKSVRGILRIENYEKISPNPSFPKRGAWRVFLTPPLEKGDTGGF